MTTTNYHRALRVPLPYIKFVERSVSVPIAGITSEPAFPIFDFVAGFETAEGSAMCGMIDGANDRETLDRGGCSGSASR